MQRLEIIGTDTELFNRYLENDDPCFGKNFAKTVDECQECQAPVIHDGRVRLLRDVCREVCQEAEEATAITLLSSREVQDRLEQGKSWEDVIREMLGDSDANVAFDEVWEAARGRFWYIRDEWELPVPEMPPKAEVGRRVGVHRYQED